MSAAVHQGHVACILLQHREGVRFCLLFSLYTILAFLVLYALDDQVVVPFT